MTARRKVGFNDIFTACFSTFVLASAIADGHRKTSRRKQWEKAIGDVKTDLEAQRIHQGRRLSTLAEATHKVSPAEVDKEGQQSVSAWQEIFAWSKRELQLRRSLGLEGWQGLPLSVLQNASSDHVREFLEEDKRWSTFKGLSGPEVWDTVTWRLHFGKLKTVEWSIAKLAIELMSSVSATPSWSIPEDPASIANVKSFCEDASALKLGYVTTAMHRRLLVLRYEKHNNDKYHAHLRSPRYPRFDSPELYDPNVADRLNAKLRALFNSQKHCSTAIEKILPAVCYYLLTSSVPPNVHTYNILLRKFAGAGRDDLIPILLRSFWWARIRPNEVTLTEALEYYCRADDAEHFNRFVRRMDGFRDGLAQALYNRKVPRILWSQYRLRIVRKGSDGLFKTEFRDFTEEEMDSVLEAEREGSIISFRVLQKARRNADVYQALIKGALQFHGLEEGMKYYCSMASEGWEPTHEILSNILDRCILDQNWEAGTALWHQLQNTEATSHRATCMKMLELCQQCSQPKAFEEAVLRGIRQNLLPLTFFEIGCHKLQGLKAFNSLAEAVTTADVLRNLEHDLEMMLCRQSGDSSDDYQRLALVANKIKELVLRPSIKTRALLQKVESIRISNEVQQISDDLDFRLSAISASTKNTLLSISVSRIEAQVDFMVVQVAHYAWDLYNILRSHFIRHLEDNVIATTTILIQFIRKSRMDLFYDRISTIRAQTDILRRELKALIASSLPPRPFSIRFHDTNPAQFTTRYGWELPVGKQSSAATMRNVQVKIKGPKPNILKPHIRMRFEYNVKSSQEEGRRKPSDQKKKAKTRPSRRKRLRPL